MSKYAALFIVFLFTSVTQAKPSDPLSGVPLKVENPGPDLPPQGSSLFDKLFYQTNTESYSVPFPIGQFVNTVVAQGSGTKVAFTLLPFTRSLQRPLDLTYDPLANPRMIFSSESDNPFLSRKLFWAYLKPKDQLEVISYNEEAGRFEFQLVKSYSHNPKVYYAPRAKCMTCHQGMGPILSINSWSDTSSNNATADLLLAKLHFKGERGEQDSFLANHFIDGAKATLNVAEMDPMVRVGSQFPTFQRIWIYGCGDSRECRLGLLLSVLAPGKTEPYVPKTPFYVNVKKVVESSPLAFERTDSSQLTGQGFGAEEVIRIMFGRSFDPFNPDMVLTEKLANSDAFKLKIIEDLRNLSSRDNPATSRLQPMSDYFSTIHALEFIDIERLTFGEEVNFYNRLIKLYESNSPLFSKKPLTTYELLEALVASKELKKIKIPRPVSVVNPEVSDSIVPTFFSSEPLNAFARNCAQCHQTGLEYPPSFLTGSQEAVQAKIKLFKDHILSRIDKYEMPPTADLQEKFKASPDREIILNYLRGFGP
jgi:hypothetical protein